MKKFSLLFVLIAGITFKTAVCSGQTGIINTIDTISGSTGNWMTIDAIGNIYVVDGGLGVVRKVAPSGVISIFAGNGTAGYSGDGGPATAAAFNIPMDITIDTAGNFYVTDANNHVIRKITPGGIISTFAGSGSYGYSGDGGPAGAAALGSTQHLTADAFGNIYLIDGNHYTIRKINASGIISTIAGTIGSPGFSGDGGPATAAQFSTMNNITADASGNIFVSDEGNHRIRKINTATGIITTIAGNGIAGYTGDGGLAIDAEINDPLALKFDGFGNLIISDDAAYVVRRVNPSGIINTIIGTGAAGYSGDGGPAKLATTNSNNGLAVDANNNVYFIDQGVSVIRKVTYSPNVSSDSMAIYIEGLCNGVSLSTLTNSTSPLTLYTYFGDGTSDVSALTTGLPGIENVNVTHVYALPGTYSIKEILRNGATAIDSTLFSYRFQLCQSFAVKFYFDANGNCTKDSAEAFNYLPIITEVDSNGVAVDTISGTSGFEYLAYGSVGDVYTFKVISTPAGISTTCPVSGIVYDTLQSMMLSSSANYIGLACTALSGFDLSEYVTAQAGRHRFEGDVIVNNPYCSVQPATVTAYTDAKYSFVDAVPAPSSVSGNVLTWNFSDIAANAPQQHIHFHLEVPGTWLVAGDTINTDYTTTPSTGDINPGNNECVRLDTVKSSYDPNLMAVTPSGTILAGTKLQYTVEFENTGNDTAFNIAVYDTLSDDVDANSLRMVASSAVMNIIPFKAGGHNVVKFDFPGINQLDSSHHNLCTGTVIFNINAKSGLPNGTTIFNHAGIFFDDNAVVMTDTVEDVIGIPTTGVMPVNTAAKVSVYPNPATDELTIKIDNGNYNTVTITNILGQEVISQTLPSIIGTMQTKLDVSRLPAGMYYLTVRGQSGTKVLKFEKM